MKCKVCGSPSGKYPLCKACNIKKEQGLIIKCEKCSQWHYKGCDCPQASCMSDGYLYETKPTFITNCEQQFFNTIKECIPSGYYVFPQINLAAFVTRTDNSPFHNELFRNVDFLITDEKYTPKIVIEINDQSHMERERRIRDKKIHDILEEAGIPILTLWTSYGANSKYITNKIAELINTPAVRKHHFESQTQKASKASKKKKQGCYIATCVYGSYDCPQVWTLRRYRDNCLSSHISGRLFIKLYYLISPLLVKCFGRCNLFKKCCKKLLNRKVKRLNAKGYDNSPYRDM